MSQMPVIPPNVGASDLQRILKAQNDRILELERNRGGIWTDHATVATNMTIEIQRSRWTVLNKLVIWQFRVWVTAGSSTAALSLPTGISPTYYPFLNIWGEHIGECSVLNNSTGFVSSGHVYNYGNSGLVLFRPHDSGIEWPGSSLVGAYLQGQVTYEPA